MRLLRAGRVTAMCAALAFGGCALGGDKTESAAVIVQPTAASRLEMQKAVDAALGRSITLANDALTRSDALSIERNAIRDGSGRRIEVREQETPELFRLVKRGSECVLIHERTKAATILRETQCAAR